ncbi:MAG: hypothetical protein IKX74_05685 [Erysipelotrichaceae bacterium]|nr:hypothetical protein [Erysipelotrichaceae bacterium]MBR5049110.1 hypothetical protein [Erysipelotrichaceae bacterium]
MARWLAVPLLAHYNGKRGECRWQGRFFYWYYPVQMTVIYLLMVK